MSDALSSFNSSNYVGVPLSEMYGRMPSLFHCAGQCGRTLDVLQEQGDRIAGFNVTDDFEIHYYCTACFTRDISKYTEQASTDANQGT